MIFGNTRTKKVEYKENLYKIVYDPARNSAIRQCLNRPEEVVYGHTKLNQMLKAAHAQLFVEGVNTVYDHNGLRKTLLNLIYSKQNPAFQIMS